MNNNCVFITALNKINIEEFKKKVYDEVKKIHITRFPYNDYLYQDYEEWYLFIDNILLVPRQKHNEKGINISHNKTRNLFRNIDNYMEITFFKKIHFTFLCVPAWDSNFWILDDNIAVSPPEIIALYAPLKFSNAKLSVCQIIKNIIKEAI